PAPRRPSAVPMPPGVPCPGFHRCPHPTSVLPPPMPPPPLRPQAKLFWTPPSCHPPLPGLWPEEGGIRGRRECTSGSGMRGAGREGGREGAVIRPGEVVPPLVEFTRQGDAHRTVVATHHGGVDIRGDHVLPKCARHQEVINSPADVAG